jgi:hypothetical protein
MLKRQLRADDLLLCLDEDVGGDGCFYVGRQYKIKRVWKDKSQRVYQVCVLCEAECEHVISHNQSSYWFRHPQIDNRSLPKWW